MWQFIKNKNFNGKHDSLEDVKAQSDIFVHDQFVRYIDTAFSVQKIEDIFSSTQQTAWKKDMESVQPVHEPWTEVTPEDDITWEPL